jgi:branched-chain amino acid transport system ATP-binding protein
LRLSNINTFYGQAQVHFDLSIDVQRGHIVCLLGGNASGKSTTMKIILGLVKPRSGELTFDGASTLGLTTPQIIRRGIAVRAGGAPAVRGHEREGKHPDGRLRAQ